MDEQAMFCFTENEALTYVESLFERTSDPEMRKIPAGGTDFLMRKLTVFFNQRIAKSVLRKEHYDESELYWEVDGVRYTTADLNALYTMQSPVQVWHDSKGHLGQSIPNDSMREHLFPIFGNAANGITMTIQDALKWGVFRPDRRYSTLRLQMLGGWLQKEFNEETVGYYGRLRIQLKEGEYITTVVGPVEGKHIALKDVVLSPMAPDSVEVFGAVNPFGFMELEKSVNEQKGLTVAFNAEGVL